ncbi:MAG: methyl-accepting chemotaxis protein, partial [Pseudomonadota bacterium]
DTSRVFEAMSKGDLSQRIDTSYQGEFASLKNDANATLEKLRVAIEKDVQSLVSSAIKGELSHRISPDNKSGFFKDLSESLNQLMDVFSNSIDDTLDVVGALAKGDLTKTIETEYQGSFAQLKQDVNATVEHLQRVIGDIQESAMLVKSGSSEIALGVSDLSTRTEQQAASLEQTAASMEQMTRSVEANTHNATSANDMTSTAEQHATAGGSAVGSAVSAMQGINESSNKIAAIISVIDEIAFQTNLLALNAAVEAARAGEQGRGFAVVAGEVRTLAQRSADAAKEIKDLITDSVERVENGSKLVNDSGKTLQEIIESVKKVSAVIGDLSVASAEQYAGIQQVNEAVGQMDEMTQQNAALVEQSSAASQSMSEQAGKLSELIGFFTLKNKPKAAGGHSPAGNMSPLPTSTFKPANTPKPEANNVQSAPPAAAKAPVSNASFKHNHDDGDWEEF